MGLTLLLETMSQTDGDIYYVLTSSARVVPTPEVGEWKSSQAVRTCISWHRAGTSEEAESKARTLFERNKTAGWEFKACSGFRLTMNEYIAVCAEAE